MTLKRRIAIYITLLFSFIFGIAATIVFVLLSNFRKDEFKHRLESKAISTMNLLLEVKEIDKQLLKIIDQNTILQLYDEKTLIFDRKFNLVYSSIDDAVIEWTREDLEYLLKHGEFFKKEGEYEIYGYFHDSTKKDYFALIAAKDEAGTRKIRYLGYILFIIFISCSTIVGFISFYFSARLLGPLGTFLKSIGLVNDQNLNIRLETSTKKDDEINQLARGFNQMMQRIEQSYQQQKEFSSYASHELRTPLARMMAQLDNKLNDPGITPENAEFLKKLNRDTGQLSDLINSLLLLTKLETSAARFSEKVRMDEVIFSALAFVKKYHPDFQLHFEIDETEDIGQLMEQHGNEDLLVVAISNLLTNASQYSLDKQANARITSADGHLQIRLESKGPIIEEFEQKLLFQPFIRGKNSRHKTGLGLGLRISQRIFNHCGITIHYEAALPDSNTFILDFKDGVPDNTVQNLPQ